MKGTALTAFLPNLTGFTSPRGLRSSRVQQVASRASSCIGEREGARRQSDRRTPSSTRCRASTERVPGEYRAGARLVPGECPAVLDPRCPVSARPATAPAATATATARGGRSPARRGGPAAAPESPPPSPAHQPPWLRRPPRRAEPRPADDRPSFVRRYTAMMLRNTTKTNPMSATSLTPRSSRGAGSPRPREGNAPGRAAQSTLEEVQRLPSG